MVNLLFLPLLSPFLQALDSVCLLDLSLSSSSSSSLDFCHPSLPLEGRFLVLLLGGPLSLGTIIGLVPTCMSDPEIVFLREQVIKLSLRVSALESQVADLRQGGNNGSVTDFELVPSVSAIPSGSADSSSSLYNRLATEIAPCPASAVQLCASLKGGRLSFKQRAERARSAGSWAKFVLAGRISKPRPSSPIDVANSLYIILRAEGISHPVRAERASDYRALVGDFTETSLSHGFASKAEARVYCLAADVPFPEEVYRWS